MTVESILSSPVAPRRYSAPTPGNTVLPIQTLSGAYDVSMPAIDTEKVDCLPYPALLHFVVSGGGCEGPLTTVCRKGGIGGGSGD